jgi:hypothetical protein
MTRYPDPTAGTASTPAPAAGTTPTDLPTEWDERPPLHVVGTEPVTLVRTPLHGVPMRETEPSPAARDLMAGAGIDLVGFDRALAEVRDAVEERADRPALAAFDDGHAQGHHDGLVRAIRLIDQRITKAEARGHRVLTAALIEIVGELRAEVQP